MHIRTNSFYAPHHPPPTRTTLPDSPASLHLFASYPKPSATHQKAGIVACTTLKLHKSGLGIAGHFSQKSVELFAALLHFEPTLLCLPRHSLFLVTGRPGPA